MRPTTSIDLRSTSALLIGAALGGWLGGWVHAWGAALGGIVGLAALFLSRRPWRQPFPWLAALLVFILGFGCLWIAASFAAVTLGLVRAHGG
jgi:hypothetical protein